MTPMISLSSGAELYVPPKAAHIPPIDVLTNWYITGYFELDEFECEVERRLRLEAQLRKAA